MSNPISCNVNGQQTTGAEATSYSISHDFMKGTANANFTVYSEDPNLRNKYLPLLPITMYIDGTPQIVGRIESVSSRFNSTALDISVRSYLQDIEYANINPKIKFKKSDTIEQAFLKVLGAYNITKITGDDIKRNILTGKRDNKDKTKEFKTSKLEEFKINYGEGVLQICKKIATKYGLLIQPALSRDEIILCKPDYEQDISYFLSREPYGNIISSNCERNWTIPTSLTLKYKTGSTKTVKGKNGEDKKVASFKDNTKTYEIIGPNSFNKLHLIPEVQSIMKNIEIESIDLTDLPEYNKPGDLGANSAAYIYRPIFNEDNDSRNELQLDNTARDIIGKYLLPTLTYKCTVKDHADQAGNRYAVNKLATVDDPSNGIYNETLWIANVEISYSSSKGKISELTMYRPNIYVV